MKTGQMKYFIRVTNVGIFNTLVEATEQIAARHHASFRAQRERGYYELSTDSAALWREAYLYGQMLAQAQDENISGGEQAR
jgi:hypothetical protein